MSTDSDEETEVPTESTRLPGARHDRLLGEWTFFQARSPRTIVLLLCLGIFCRSAAVSIATVPVTRILEDILCRRHYDGLQGRTSDDGIDERLCKGDIIQSELAYLLGAMSTVEAITSIALAFPYGIIADRIGRKPVYVLSVLGTMLGLIWIIFVLRFPWAVPLRLIILFPAFQIIGGGDSVVIAMVYSMAADVEPDSRRATAFFIMTFASLTGYLLGPLASSKLMEIGLLWTPLLIAVIISALGMGLIIFVPETLQIEPSTNYDPPQAGEILIPNIMKHLKCALPQIMESLSMLKSPPLLFILLTWLTQYPVIIAMNQLFSQYVSKRFGWTLAKTGYLLSIHGIANIVVLTTVLPVLSKLLVTPRLPFRFSASKKDLTLAKLSALFLALGSFLIASPGVATVISGSLVITLGAGLAPLCRSLITRFTDAQHTSRLYTIIGIVEAVGALYSGPGLAWFFTTGMRLKGLWLGLPYFWLSSLCAFAWLSLCLVTTGDSEETIVY